MKFLISLIFIAFLFLVPLVLYRKIYFRPVSCIVVNPDNSVRAVSVIPKKSFFRSFSGGRNYSLVHIGNELYAFYVDPLLDSEYSESLSFVGLNFSGSIFIFSRNKLGRFNSIDLSKRTVFDIIKKFEKFD